jgi:UDPglucose 6-dehydrogenase
MRNAPSITIIKRLHTDGAALQAYDPQATSTAKAVLGNTVSYKKNMYDTLKGADALVIMTEWEEFKEPDWEKVRSLLRNPIVIDGRNLYPPEKMEKLGFVYHSVGRG